MKKKKLRSAKYAKNPLVGEKNGNGTGKMSFIALRDAEETKKLVDTNYYFPNKLSIF